VYDGDTFTVVIKFGGNDLDVRCRALGYDSPEMKPKLSDPDRDNIIKAAHEAKAFLSSMILNKVIYITFYEKNDMYGRSLVTIEVPDESKKMISVNECMIKTDHGKLYNGGTKGKDLNITYEDIVAKYKAHLDKCDSQSIYTTPSTGS
jgi:hypothetical protein